MAEKKARKAVIEALGASLPKVDDPVIDYLVGTHLPPSNSMLAAKSSLALSCVLTSTRSRHESHFEIIWRIF
jgi:hypothetical protein